MPHVDATWPAVISAFASACSAAAAAFGNFRASREMKRWRDQRREGKRADVAAEVLVSTLRFLSALTSTTTTLSARSDAEDSDGFRAEVSRRWAAIDAISNEFVKAWELAEAYLPDEVDGLLGRIWESRAEILAEQHTFFATPLPHGAEFFKGGFGSAPRRRLEELRAEARRVLRPLAQHDDDTPSKRSVAEHELAGSQPSQLPPGK